MAFLPKTDYYSLATTGSGLVIISSEENKSASVAEAQNDKGDVVATYMYGITAAPSCSYVLNGVATLSGVKIGDPITTGSAQYTITNVSI